MTTFAVAIKNEIRRLARKEVKSQTQSTTQSVTRHRHEIAQLKRQIREQQKQIARLTAQTGQREVNREQQNGTPDGIRFSARSVKAQRRRTGLSAADYAKLVGVSPLTIYNWENSKSRPRKEQFAALVAVRGIGKREAIKKLELLEPKAKKVARKLQRIRRKRK
jgi:DNA-binding transcriptional regulator YiaG